jgi:anthranilate synthase component 2
VKTLIIDNYDSFVYNLVQYVGQLGGNPIVFRNDQITLKQVLKLKPSRIIISPGPGTPEVSKYFGNSLAILQRVGCNIPTLGVCLGHQGIIYAFGGKIVRAKKLMHGKVSLITHDGEGVFKGVKNPFEATRYHSLVGDESSIPPCLKITARSLNDHEIMGVRHVTHPIEGIQFHPESILTHEGVKIIKNFLNGVKT